MLRSAHLPLIASLVVPSIGHAADLDISKYAKVYRGPEGLEITFVALKSDDGALIRVSGVDTEIDGVVMRYASTPQGRGGSRYHTELHGERFGTFHIEKASAGGMRYAIFLPEAPMARVSVAYDEARSKAENSDNLLSAFLKPKNKKQVEKLAAWNRPERVKKQNAWLEEEAALARKKCEHKLPVSIDWKSVTDDTLKTYSIYGYCSAPINALRQICESSAEYRGYVKKKVTKVRCRFGAKLDVQLAKGELRFTTETGAPNQQEFVHDFLKNKL